VATNKTVGFRTSRVAAPGLSPAALFEHLREPDETYLRLSSGATARKRIGEGKTVSSRLHTLFNDGSRTLHMMASTNGGQLSLDDLYHMVAYIYSERNAERSASATFAHFVEVCGAIAVDARDKKNEHMSVEDALAKAT